MARVNQPSAADYDQYAGNYDLAAEHFKSRRNASKTFLGAIFWGLRATKAEHAASSMRTYATRARRG